MSKAVLLWTYRCRSCGEPSSISQGFLDYLMTGKIRRPPIRCHLCDTRGDYETDYDESMIMGELMEVTDDK